MVGGITEFSIWNSFIKLERIKCVKTDMAMVRTKG